MSPAEQGRAADGAGVDLSLRTRRERRPEKEHPRGPPSPWEGSLQRRTRTSVRLEAGEFSNLSLRTRASKAARPTWSVDSPALSPASGGAPGTPIPSKEQTATCVSDAQ